MKKKLAGVLAAAAVLLVSVAGIGSAQAYFTTYVEATGSRTISLGDVTNITEEYSSFVKTVRIHNDAASAKAVYVRVKAFCGEDYTLTPAGTGWSEGEGGYWYFADPVAPNADTGALDISIRDKDGNIPASEEGKEFNVVIVYETVPAVENGAGAYEPADWNATVTGGEENV